MILESCSVFTTLIPPPLHTGVVLSSHHTELKGAMICYLAISVGAAGTIKNPQNLNSIMASFKDRLLIQVLRGKVFSINLEHECLNRVISNVCSRPEETCDSNRMISRNQTKIAMNYYSFPEFPLPFLLVLTLKQYYNTHPRFL